MWSRIAGWSFDIAAEGSRRSRRRTVARSIDLVPELPPPPPDLEPDGAERVVLLDPPPRPGELTLGWRVVTALTWIAVVLALAGVWNASSQLGLSTWWLGPRGEPQPRLLRLVPFVPSLLMVLGTINNVRWLGRFGIAAALAVGAVGVADLDRVTSIAVTELLIAAAAGAVSIASLTGTYRAPVATDDRGVGDRHVGDRGETDRRGPERRGPERRTPRRRDGDAGSND